MPDILKLPERQTDFPLFYGEQLQQNAAIGINEMSWQYGAASMQDKRLNYSIGKNTIAIPRKRVFASEIFCRANKSSLSPPV